MRVGIIGGSGFAGSTLAQILTFHPDVELTYISSRRYVGKYIHQVIPNLHNKTRLKFDLPENDLIEEKCDIIFTAVPHHTSHEMIPDLLDLGLKVIDLSADYRLKDLKKYNEYYGNHSSPSLFKDAVYGMPELYREKIKNAKLIAVPGCQASCAIYALAPLINENLIDRKKIIVDSKTGSSGSGASATEASHHPIRANSIRPYKMTGHRHTAEIEQELSNICGEDVKVGFSAHAVNLTRGILGTIYSFPLNEIDERTIIKAYRKFYRKEKFIRFRKMKAGLFRLPDPKLIMGTNYVDVGFELDNHIDRIISLCALDNLVKGTAGNATQCLNIIAGFPQEKGIKQIGMFPY